MATKTPLRLTTTLPLRLPLRTTKRTFLSSLLPDNIPPIHINVSRTLPYPRKKLYDLIADVDSYSRFLPYCKHSRVTAWTTITTSTTASSHEQAPQNAETRKYPSAGELSLGWGPLDHTYTSRIVCVPRHSVEAHSGDDEPLCRQADEQRGGYRNPFRKLSTQWALKDALGESGDSNIKTKTVVDLDINMTLRDPMTQAVLSQMVDGVAEEMIVAFERRAEELFGLK